MVRFQHGQLYWRIIWKPLKYGELDLTDRFEISNTGKLRNVNTKKELKLQINHEGYKNVCVSLGKRNCKKIIKIHRAVAFMFLDGHKEGLVVNHIDLDKTNNNVENLEWITEEENRNHAYLKKTRWSSKPRKVKCLQTNQIFNSLHEAIRWCGLKNVWGIILVAKGKQPHAGKHPITGEKLSWEYVE